MNSTLHGALGILALLGGSALVLGGGCKENNLSNDESVGKCSVPAGTCPEGFSPEVTGEGSIEDCEMDGEGECKKVGSCTVRCVDPRGCTSVGSVCGDDKPACCGQTAQTHDCIHYINEDPDKDQSVCSMRCTKNADCPASCCDATINNGTFAVCAPYDVCVGTTGAPPDCVTCLDTECPDEMAACRDDETCAACLVGDIYPKSPDCRNNTVLKRGYGCALQKCPDVCEM